MELEIIKHCDISHEDLLRVINIKNAAWPYPIESQMIWIKENQNLEDLHIILKERNNDYAYMNLCAVTAVVDGIETSFMGIGNVCSKTKGLGHGGHLVSLVNKYLEDNNLKGMLFCKEHVMHFYAHYNWQIIPSEAVTIAGEKYDGVYTMTFNAPAYKKIIYSDRLF